MVIALILLIAVMGVCQTSEPGGHIPCQHSHRSASQKIFRYISSKTMLSEHAKNDSCIIHSIDEAPHSPMHLTHRHPTIMLDLDETCLFGNDGNDLGIALQCVGRAKDLNRLYELLINPALRPAYDTFRKSAHCEGGLILPRVIIYTARSTLLYYASEFRPKPVALRSNSCVSYF